MQTTNTRGWLFDETAHAGEEHLDAGYVQGYDRKAGTDPGDDIALLRGLGLDETDMLIDFGAGTGTFALAVAPLCRSVIAIDVSMAMLDNLERKAEQLGIANIECVHAGFLSYEHHGDPVGFVYTRNALHHLPDFWKAIALARIAAIMRPGGVFRLRDLVYSFDPREMEEIFESWLAGAAGDPALGWTRPELETHIREEYSTFSWLLEPMLERAGFTIQNADNDRRVYSAYTCTTT
jgi:ubiquinone/menaquinone biosynthesis C-methylase UbiE